MKRNMVLAAAALFAAMTLQAKVQHATSDQVVRVEPPCWWTGMKTSLQLMVQGPGISGYDVSIQGKDGVSITGVHKADNPDFIFVDVAVSGTAVAGEYDLVFEKGKDKFRYTYTLGTKSFGQRESFSTSDVIYLIVPDRFANGDPSNDSTPDTDEKAAREEPFGRHGGDIRGIIDHLDYIADLGATAIWMTPLLKDNARWGSYHGYACADYYNIDSRFGDNALYKEMVSKAYESGIEFYVHKPVNSIEIESVLKNVEAGRTMKKLIAKAQDLFSNDNIPSSAAVSDTQAKSRTGKAYMQRLRGILQGIGISGESGSKDIISIIEYLMDNDMDVSDSTLNDLCGRLHRNPKSVEQRIRRAAFSGMVNLANKGLEDYADPVFNEYSGRLYNFEQIRKEMNYIRGRSEKHGNVRIRNFLTGLLSYCREA